MSGAAAQACRDMAGDGAGPGGTPDERWTGEVARRPGLGQGCPVAVASPPLPRGRREPPGTGAPVGRQGCAARTWSRLPGCGRQRKTPCHGGTTLAGAVLTGRRPAPGIAGDGDTAVRTHVSPSRVGDRPPPRSASYRSSAGPEPSSGRVVVGYQRAPRSCRGSKSLTRAARWSVDGIVPPALHLEPAARNGQRRASWARSMHK